MRNNPVYDKAYLAKLGITADTDPNDPSTWSEDLKKRHSNTVSSLPQEIQKRVKIAPAVAPDGNLQSEIVGNSWKDNISKKYDSLVDQSQAKYDGDGDDGRPGKVDPKEWASLTAQQKNAVIDFVRAKRFHDIIRQPENLDVHGAINYDEKIFHGVSPRVAITAEFFPHNKKTNTPALVEEKRAAHKKAMDIVKPYDEWGTNRTDEFKATQDNLESNDEPTDSTEDSYDDDLNDANFERSNALHILNEEQNRNGQTSDESGVVKRALDRVSNGGENNLQDEQSRIKNILEEEKQSYPEGHPARQVLTRIASRLGYNSTAYSYDGALNSEQPSTPSVQEQNQAETEAGSNVSAQMTEAAAQSNEEDPQERFRNAVGSITESLAGIHSILKQSIMDGTEHIYPEANRISDAAATRILIQKGLAADWNEGYGIVRNLPRGTDGFQHSNMTILSEFSNYLNKNTPSQPTNSSSSEEEPESSQTTEEPETSSYTGPGSVEYANTEKMPISKGLLADGSTPKWKDVEVAIRNGIGKASPGAKKLLRRVSPDIGGHVLDIDEVHRQIVEHPGFSDQAKKASADDLKSGFQTIYQWVKSKAESTPDEPATDLPRSLRQDEMIDTFRGVLERKNTNVDESSGLTKEGQDIYRESVELAEKAKEEGRLGPRDVVYDNRTRKNVDSRGKRYGSSGYDMSSEQYEAWAAQKKAEGWTEWKAESPMSSEDLAAQKQAARDARPASVKIPTSGSRYSSQLSKEERFDTDLRPTNVSKDHWAALKAYSPEAATFVSMYAHKWHNLVDSGAIAPEGKASKGEQQRYTVDQLKSDKQAVLNQFEPRLAQIRFDTAKSDAKYKMQPLLSTTVKGQLVNTDTDAADKINEILKAYPMPE